ncbi:hypothetical protein ABGB05_36800, partial [Plantactinospora sp. B5E13]
AGGPFVTPPPAHGRSATSSAPLSTSPTSNTDTYRIHAEITSLDAARRRGAINVYCLGIGVDALNYVGDLLTVAVFEADVFDRIFDGLVDKNDEGELASEELAFDEHTVDRLLSEGRMAPSGAACLHLTWQHRNAILSRGQ